MTDESGIEITSDGEFARGLEPLGDAPMPPALAVGAIALNMAMKYHDISIIKDGAMYQQYKLEGRNIVPIHLDMVFETAILIEKHLMSTSNRLSEMVFDAVVDGLAEEILAEDAAPSEQADDQ